MKKHFDRTDANPSSSVLLMHVYTTIASHNHNNITKGSLLLSNTSQLEEIFKRKVKEPIVSIRLKP